jgi:UTP--glucose-1-phosphate uridylyltransferase
MKIKKALITCAGFGTRFLPITKTIQKEMLPIIDRPLIDYVVADCIKAGIEEIIFVVGEHNYQVMHYYRENQRLYEYLKKFNKVHLYEQIAHLHTQAKFHFVKQKDSDPYGTAVPVILAKDYLRDEQAFLVLMGDDFVYQDGEQSVSKAMIDTFAASGAKALLTCVEKPTEVLSKYGVIKSRQQGAFQFLDEIIEKPAPGLAPSNLVNISNIFLVKKFGRFLVNKKLILNLVKCTLLIVCKL